MRDRYFIEEKVPTDSNLKILDHKWKKYRRRADGR